MARGIKRYNTAYKKRVDVERDTYLPRRSPKGLRQCRHCGSVYYRQRWTLNPPEGIRGRLGSPGGAVPTSCPACRKIRERYPMGELRLAKVHPKERQELLRVLRNEEGRAREKNPLERIMRIERDNAGLRVETTTEKLAQRLGRSLKKARGGKVEYNWSHNNKFVRVFWWKEPAEKAAKSP